MLVLGAADEAHRGHPEAVLVDAALGGRHHVRVVGEAEVVVRAQVEHPPAVGEGDLGLLLPDDLALVFGEALGLDRGELGLEVRAEALGGARHAATTDGAEDALGMPPR